MKLASLALVPLFALPLFTMSNADEDRAAVERAVKDYVEGIYQVKPELVERGVHADLAKLGFWRADETTEYRGPMSMTKEQLVELSKEWNAEGRELTTDGDGKLQGTRAVFVADGAVFPSLPAKGLTFSIMANADRVGSALARGLS